MDGYILIPLNACRVGCGFWDGGGAPTRPLYLLPNELPGYWARDQWATELNSLANHPAENHTRSHSPHITFTHFAKTCVCIACVSLCCVCVCARSGENKKEGWRWWGQEGETAAHSAPTHTRRLCSLTLASIVVAKAHRDSRPAIAFLSLSQWLNPCFQLPLWQSITVTEPLIAP